MLQNISGENATLLDTEGDLELWLLGTENIPEFNAFILRVYNQAFTKGEFTIPASDIEPASAEFFHRARVCGVRHRSGALVGTWGLVVKELADTIFQLPTEQKYALPLAKIAHDLNAPQIRYVFNGWRNAIDKDALEEFHIDRNKSIFIFDFLLRGLTQDFQGIENECLGIADMEMLVYKYHRRVGIPWHIVGEPIHFWSRDRYPCAFKLGEYRDYMLAHHPERAAFLFDKSRGAA